MRFSVRYSFKLVKSFTIMSSERANKFNLTNYDVIGIDFDNTIVQYNLTNLFTGHYDFLTTYLVTNKGYNGLATKMSDFDIDFIRRGLFLDFKEGNILNISDDGTILGASHGTRKLTELEIIKNYGLEKKWIPTTMFVNNKLLIKEDSLTNSTFCFFDFTDSVAVLVFAKLVDLVDLKEGSILQDYNRVWRDLLQSIVEMYKNESTFIKSVGKNLSEYAYKCDQKILDWLKELGEKFRLILITSSGSVYLNYIAKYALGDKWENLFYTIIDTAGKPKFFTGNNSFKNEKGKAIVLNTSRGSYSNGNWPNLYKVLTEEMGRPVKCIYIGDSFVHDIYAPTAVTNCPPLDTLSIIEELLADGYFDGTHPHKAYINSRYWDNLYLSNGKLTVLGDIIKKHSKLSVPSLRYLAEKPIDYEHTPFWINLKEN